MGHEAIELDEAAFVEQEVEPFPGGELSLLVLLRDPVGTSALFGESLTVVEIVERSSDAINRI